MSGISAGTLNEDSALGLTAFWRAVTLIAGTISGLPLRVYADLGNGQREQVPHFLSDSPAGPYDLSAFSWVEMVMAHLLIHGEAFLKSVVTEDGDLVGLWPIHPLAINSVKWDGPDRVFEVGMQHGRTESYISGEVTQVLGLTTDGTRGLSPLSIFRNVLNTAKAGDTAANASLTSGSLIAGLVTAEEEVDEVEAKTISERLNAKMKGAENAGSFAFVNRALRFTPWRMTNVDAQFLETRGMSVEEVARIYGLPLSLLSAGGAVSSFGTGVAEANLALQKYVLVGWTSRLESALKAILPVGHFAEFQYAGLMAGTPRVEIELLLAQVAGGLLTSNEARAIRNLPPIEGGDTLRSGSAPEVSQPPASQGGEVAA